MQIFPIHLSHLDSLVQLFSEFDFYLGTLSQGSRESFDREGKRNMFLKYAFCENPSFQGYVAEVDGEIIGYALYHYGFDPDEMQGKVIHLIDFFVSERARGRGVGRALIEKLQSHEDSLGLYFGVWKKNIGAIDFYHKLGADWIEDVPFMKLLK